MKISILGTGAYGIALAKILKENNNEITMWTKFENEKEEILKTRENPLFPNIKIEEDIKITTDIKEACIEKDVIILALPIVAICETTKLMAPYIKKQIIISASKGIEQGTCLFVSDIVKKHMNNKNYAMISGPTFAIDMLNKMPCGVSIASTNKKVIKIAKDIFQNDHFKLRETNDVKGVEISSAIKNVIAIGSGILEGLEANESTKAMYLTESLNDIKYLIKKLGGNEKTILTYAGFGDILMTCNSTKSRNYTFGKMLVKNTKEEIKKYKENTTVEGLYTLESILKLVEIKKVNIQIIYLLNDIINNNKEPKKLLEFLIQKK